MSFKKELLKWGIPLALFLALYSIWKKNLESFISSEMVLIRAKLVDLSSKKTVHSLEKHIGKGILLSGYINSPFPLVDTKNGFFGRNKVPLLSKVKYTNFLDDEFLLVKLVGLFDFQVASRVFLTNRRNFGESALKVEIAEPFSLLKQLDFTELQSFDKTFSEDDRPRSKTLFPVFRKYLFEVFADYDSQSKGLKTRGLLAGTYFSVFGVLERNKNGFVFRTIDKNACSLESANTIKISYIQNVLTHYFVVEGAKSCLVFLFSVLLMIIAESLLMLKCVQTNDLLSLFRKMKRRFKKTKNNKKDSGSLKSCFICYDKTACVVLSPCCHLVCCIDCYGSWAKKCPVCRTEVLHIKILGIV